MHHNADLAEISVTMLKDLCQLSICLPAFYAENVVVWKQPVVPHNTV